MMKERLVKRLIASIKCGSCGQNYGESNIDVMGHSEDLWFLVALCPSCNTQCLVAAIIKEDSAPEIVTDLTKAELDKFRNMDMVGADDVLDMHNFLKDFDGDLPRLFRRG